MQDHLSLNEPVDLLRTLATNNVIHLACNNLIRGAKDYVVEDVQPIFGFQHQKRVGVPSIVKRAQHRCDGLQAFRIGFHDQLVAQIKGYCDEHQAVSKIGVRHSMPRTG
jgi:hypothetical protein